MGARQRDEVRNQDQKSPYVGERIRHDDRSGTIKHNLENYRGHELPVQDRQGWTGVDRLSVARGRVEQEQDSRRIELHRGSGCKSGIGVWSARQVKSQQGSCHLGEFSAK